MQLKQLTITNKAIIFTALYNQEPGTDVANEEERKVTAREAPLPELTKAFEKLKGVVCEIMAFPKDYAEGMAVHRVAVSVTKHGTRAVCIGFKKALDTIGGQLHGMDTPHAKIEKPQDGESGEMQVSKKSADLIKAALHQAERYAKGERSQQLLDFDKDKEALNAQVAEGEGLFE